MSTWSINREASSFATPFSGLYLAGMSLGRLDECCAWATALGGKALSAASGRPNFEDKAPVNASGWSAGVKGPSTEGSLGLGGMAHAFLFERL